MADRLTQPYVVVPLEHLRTSCTKDRWYSHQVRHDAAQATVDGIRRQVRDAHVVDFEVKPR